MRRIAIVIFAVVTGQLATWFFIYVTGRIHWPRRHGQHGCYEIDHCGLPWWSTVLFIAWLFGPALAYGAIAFFGSGRRWSLKRWIATASIVFAATGCLYLLGWVIRYWALP